MERAARHGVVKGILVVLLVLTAGAAAAQSTAPPAFGPTWKALVGDWVGDGSGAPGSGGGAFSFRFDLDGRVLIRRNRTEVAGAPGKTPAVHDDLMVVYPVAAPGEARAFYADNEGHVIQYEARWSGDGRTLTFLSDAAAGQPRFKLIYTFQSATDVTIGFEIATPDSPATFKPYLTGKARRTSGEASR